MTEWLWGRRAVAEVLAGSKRQVRRVWIEAGPSSPALEQIVHAAKAAGVAVEHVDGPRFASLELRDAQRVAAECTPFVYRNEDEIPPPAVAGRSILVVLDHIEDPQNTGAILRTAEAAGCIGACVPKRRAAQITPAVVRASAGAAEHLDVFRVGNVARLLERLQKDGYWTVALASGAEQAWDQVDYRGHVALVVGSEGKGVQRVVRERCDFRVELPMAGRVGSLNASAAFAAVIYEVVRQQRGG